MKVETIFCDNYFPPTIIECNKWKDETYTNYTKYTYPCGGKYDKSVFGVWRVKYKTLNPNYYLAGQIK
ncbi:hypothetical protein [Flavobacterium phage V157]|uniref:Uncharacterized protein n=20 Tax=Ficleduovirus TaxID=2560131 RepID=A0A0A0YQ53_9CAUD|nr:hypothetical protein ABG42_gp02 [Flavobacterium phage FCL-2]YP_009591088.1 hypothetical protein FDG55_gp02 [Flavobacterium phage FCV-1]ASD51586.1 hypothetical protein [Flavobacterium phage FCV-3]ASD51660.1 hypothetical protein [Flavobacterium phage FCV-11]ASD51734.1 hypothetical protein [Flavobacterium phage V175]ASD51812.1 hypothetical protein [Flavobacterium phage V181]ASD52490.1 hypothetical protein [Flavobacterium phage FCV-10]ASD52563.1 hypothetical protein [Flavobacterium phage FCV-